MPAISSCWTRARTPLLKLRADSAESLDELLFALMICADDRAIEATYVAGELVYARDTAN